MKAEKRTRRKYTEDFKRDAVALVTEQGYKVPEAARSLGIGDNLLRRWKQGFEEESTGNQLSTDERKNTKSNNRRFAKYRCIRFNFNKEVSIRVIIN